MYLGPLELKKEHFIATVYLVIIYFLGSVLLNFVFEGYMGLDLTMNVWGVPAILFVLKFALILYLSTKVFKFSTKDVPGLAVAHFLLFLLLDMFVAAIWRNIELLGTHYFTEQAALKLSGIDTQV